MFFFTFLFDIFSSDFVKGSMTTVHIQFLPVEKSFTEIFEKLESFGEISEISDLRPLHGRTHAK